ncbi:hypothetical protein [Tatumella ptyseos]|nr:hypothetical protein [Tatumella ptyseos]
MTVTYSPRGVCSFLPQHLPGQSSLHSTVLLRLRQAPFREVATAGGE